MIYLSHTRPDIAYSVNEVSQFMHDPHLSHLEVVYHILRYLKSTPRKGLLFYNNDHLMMRVFTDADRARSLYETQKTNNGGKV